MADQFEKLLTAPVRPIASAFTRIGIRAGDTATHQIERLAAAFGLKTTQFVCALGFNPNREELREALATQGFRLDEDFDSRRNYLFIHDQYRELSVSNVLAVYTVIGRMGKVPASLRDLVLARLETIETRLDETINPALLSSFRLDVRGVYERGVADEDFAQTRLSVAYEVSRRMADEARVMVDSGVLSGLAMLRSPTLSADEKRGLIFHGLVSDDELETFAAEVGDDDPLAVALAG